MRKIFFIFFILLWSCAKDKTAYKAKVQNSDFFHKSMKEITDRMVHDIFSPPVASRIYVYTSVAGYEAIIHQDKKYKSLAGQLHGLEKLPQPDSTQEYCYPLAAAEAMLKVGRALIFSEDELDKFYNKVMQEFKDAGVPDDVFERSIGFGDSIAKHIMDWASGDNYKQSRTFSKYTIESSPGTWKPTPPAYMDAIEPHWNKIRTFVIDSAAQFQPEPPQVFSIDKKSQFYKEAYYVFETGKNLTQEQRAIASFWDCNPFVMNVKGHVMFATKKISPGGHWVNITRLACNATHADITRSAEAYVRVAISLADGFISCWDEKYRSKLVRPETYINQYIDENWAPLLQTPPFPEYTSGHSVVSTSACVALTGLFGDNFAYTDSTETEFGLPPRSFKSFRSAAEEAAVSRIYGGIHYLPACENGKVQGTALGEFIASRIVTSQSKKIANK